MDVRTLFIILILLALVVISVLAIFLYFKEPDMPTDQSIVHNYLPQYTHGHSIGFLVKRIKGPDRDAIIFRPTDYNFAEGFRSKEKIKMEDEIVFVEKEKVNDRPRGVLSEHKHELILLPPYPEDLPDSFKKTPDGKALMREIEDINNNNVERDVLRESSNRKDKFLKELPNGEISTSWMEHMSTIQKDFMKLSNEKNQSKPPVSLGGNFNQEQR